MERYEFGGPGQDIGSEAVIAARFGLSPTQLGRYLKVLDRAGKLSEQLGQTQSDLNDANMRLAAMNRYLWLKAAGLVDNPAAISMLAMLHEQGKLSLRRVGLGKVRNAIALARLTGALLCEVTDREVWITPQGEDFYRRVSDDQTPNSSEAILDQP